MFTNIIGIAVALALDAFGVAMGLGCGQKLNFKEKSLIILSFGLFQFLFAFSGAFVGNFVDKNLFHVTDYISGLIIFILGIFMIREGLKNDEACFYRKLSIWVIVILGMSVSIDALGVGFSLFFNYDFFLIFNKSLIIGLIAFLFTFISLMITKYIKNFAIVEKYSDYLGGFILLIFGLNMIL